MTTCSTIKFCLCLYIIIKPDVFNSFLPKPVEPEKKTQIFKVWYEPSLNSTNYGNWGSKCWILHGLYHFSWPHKQFFFFFIRKLTQTRETCRILFIFITRGWQVKFQVRFHSEAIGEPDAIFVCVFKLQKSSNIG